MGPRHDGGDASRALASADRSRHAEEDPTRWPRATTLGLLRRNRWHGRRLLWTTTRQNGAPQSGGRAPKARAASGMDLGIYGVLMGRQADRLRDCGPHDRDPPAAWRYAE